MRQKEILRTGPRGLDMTVGYPNSVAFLYSPQLVRIECLNENAGALPVAVGVTHTESGRSYRETRYLYNGAATFDISRIMQLLAPDVDTLFQRLDNTPGATLSEHFELNIEYNDDDWHWLLENERLTVMYGALDQGETYGGPSQRRLYMNLPQTFNLWGDEGFEPGFIVDGVWVWPDIRHQPVTCYESDLIQAMQVQFGDLRKVFPEGIRKDIQLTWRFGIEAGRETALYFRTVTLVPDYHTTNDGTYLRWLNRRGEVSYGLFVNSQIRVAAAANETFSRYYANDPSEPVAGAYINTQKTDYNEVREMIIGAVGLSYDEFQDMCDLATSPLVEMLIPEQTLWQRVNVVAGTFERNIRRNTPNRQDLEIIIRLPERNTIKL